MPFRFLLWLISPGVDLCFQPHRDPPPIFPLFHLFMSRAVRCRRRGDSYHPNTPSHFMPRETLGDDKPKLYFLNFLKIKFQPCVSHFPMLALPAVLMVGRRTCMVSDLFSSRSLSAQLDAPVSPRREAVFASAWQCVASLRSSTTGTARGCSASLRSVSPQALRMRRTWKAKAWRRQRARAAVERREPARPTSVGVRLSTDGI